MYCADNNRDGNINNPPVVDDLLPRESAITIDRVNQPIHIHLIVKLLQRISFNCF